MKYNAANDADNLVAVSQDTATASFNAEVVAMGSIIKNEIDEAMQELSDHHRLLITLADVEQMTYREIAEVIGIPIGTVMSGVYRARRSLREIILGGDKKKRAQPARTIDDPADYLPTANEAV